jgi:hypothetical protein
VKGGRVCEAKPPAPQYSTMLHSMLQHLYFANQICYNENMKDNKIAILVHIIIGALVVFAFHFLALQFSFYWTIRVGQIGIYDIPMHIAGGALIGLCILWLAYFSEIPEKFGIKFSKKSATVFLTAWLGMLSVGIGWEIWEWISGMTRSDWTTDFYRFFDIGKDLVDDSLGALLVAKVYLKRILE